MSRSRVSRPAAAFQRPMALQSPFKGLQDNQRKEWFRFENAADGTDTTHIYIYDMIGGWFGITADEMLYELKKVDTGSITLHINSPGGDVFDAVAIYNALRAHKADVHVVVDALAASAASFIAQAGDSITMNQGSMMMIHDASAGSYENADGHRFTGDILDKVSNNISEIYAGRAGGTAATWRATMKEEAWYSAKEAVDAGLADSVGDVKATDNPTDHWDLSIFNYAGRSQAPNPFEVMNRITTKETQVGKATNETQSAPEPTPGENTPNEEGQTTGTPEVPDENAGTEDETPATEGAPATSGTPPTTPENKASGFVMKVNGQVVTDLAAVQAHIDTLEGFRNETSEANRKAFVEALARDNKIAASSIDKLTAYALSRPTDEEFTAWADTWDDAPSNSAFARHVAPGVTNENGDKANQTDLEKRLETARGILDQHKKSKMRKEQLEKTASYLLLKANNRLLEGE